MFSNKADVCENLEKLFADRFYITNVLVMVDVLIDEGLYSEAEIYLKRIESVEEYEMDKKYLNARISFLKKEYQIAHRKFLSFVAEDLEKGILHNVMGKSLEYLVVCSLICNDHVTAYHLLMQKSTSEEEQRILAWFLEEKEDSFEKTARSKIFSILSLLLKVFEVDLFEQKLAVLNLIESNEILLDLANLYYENGYKDLAVKSILKSVKELDVMNADAAYLLNKEI